MTVGAERFEFDEVKSEANRAKHGIDFEMAQKVWLGPDRWQGVLAFPDEPRSLVVGLIEGKLWSIVVTYRSDAIRILSARRSRPNEVINCEQDAR